MKWFHVALLSLLLVVVLAPLGCGDDDDDNNDSGADDDDNDDDNDDTTDDDDNDDDDDDDNNDDDNDDTTDLTVWVDPFIGTSGDNGQLHPAAVVPFGMVKLGPDTLALGHAGYDYLSQRVRGFSHTRIGGVGCTGAGGSLRLRPTADATAGSTVPMRKATEQASPGFYSVVLDDTQPIGVELTATTHAGFHRYTFGDGGQVYLRGTLDQPFDDHRDAQWNIDGNRIHGFVAAENVCGRGQYKFYFDIEFNLPFDVVSGTPGADGTQRFVLGFTLEDDRQLLAKVGLATVDAAQARAMHEAEIDHWDFDRTRADAQDAWQTQLARVEVSGNDEWKTLFYTLLYRSSLVPADITGPDGAYRGTDGQVHTADGYRRYHCWSLWDTFRTKFPLITLLSPERSRDMMRSLVELYMQGKADWATELEPYPTVRTEHAAALLLDAIAKGIDDFAVADAYYDILDEAVTLPTDSPDKILETAYDYWAMAEIAGIVGDDETRDDFLAEARAYVDTWNENFLVMGDDADVMHARGLYEGTLWQYRWAVIHDLHGIIDLLGGRDEFLAQLTQFFDEELYNHGNEPDLHTAFLFNYVGAPWRTQQLVRDLLTNPVNQWYGTHNKWPLPYHGRIYRAEPKGYIPEMDDDVGTMAAWFVWAAMGLYPVTVGQPIYQLTAPIFDKVVIHVGATNDFVIRATGLSAANIFIQDAALNGAPLTRAWLTHDQVAAGGELELVMGNQPNQTWGAAEADAPPPAMQ